MQILCGVNTAQSCTQNDFYKLMITIIIIKEAMLALLLLETICYKNGEMLLAVESAEVNGSSTTTTR